MECKVCKKELVGKSKILCNICTNKKHKILCKKCGKECEISAGYVRRIDLVTFNCKQCKLHGEGNPNFGKKWSIEKRKKFSELTKSRVDENYRKKCSKGMKGKKVSEDAKNKRKITNSLKILNGYVKPEMSEKTKEKIGKKSSLKFTEEYKQKMRVINEKNGVWIPLEKKDDYKFYREISNWVGQVITENTIGVENLKNGVLFNKENKNKNKPFYVRDHIFGRKNGFYMGVFPEIIRHPSNCQLITHGDNVRKSFKNNDSEIELNELFNKIINWGLEYFEQSLCLELINNYKNGERYNKNDYICKIKNNKYVKI
jgi:hypothetical protein